MSCDLHVMNIHVSCEYRCTNCAAVIQIMENEIIRANEMKSDKTKQKESLEQEVKNEIYTQLFEQYLYRLSP